MTFEELGVSEPLRRAISEIGFVEPMPVQEQVIPYLLGNENDVVALAQTGTGKTAAYGLPLIQKTNTQDNSVQAVIISPTRELCLQIADDLKSYSKYIDHLHVLAVYGGAGIDSQIRQLKKGVQIIVATPGRLVDLMNRGVAKLDQVKNVVLDEADEMLSMGFSESIDTILEHVPTSRNTLLFSATMSKEIERISKNYLHEAKEIQIGSRNEGAEKVNHIYYLVQARDKYNALKRLADFYPEIYAIIFCRTRMETQEIADKLIQDGYNADSLHGDLSQAQRDIVMQRFRQHHIQLLVATDVAARGLDVADLTHVINYGLPDDLEQYVHRSGRTGRAGKQGTSLCIIHVKEKSKVRAIEKEIGKEFVQGTLPTGEEICKKQLLKVMDDIEHAEVDEELIAPFLTEIERKFELMDKEDIVKRVVSMEFNTFLNYYKNAPEIFQPTGKKGEFNSNESRSARQRGNNRNGSRQKGIAQEGYTRLFINIGKLDKLHVREFMGVINRAAKGQHFDIGRIDLLKSFSFFEVPTPQVDSLIRTLKGTDFNGRAINIEVTDNQAHPISNDSNNSAPYSRNKRESGSYHRNSGAARRIEEKGQYTSKKKNKKSEDEFAQVRERSNNRKRPEWAQFFDGQVEDQPFWGQFAKKNKKNKK